MFIRLFVATFLFITIGLFNSSVIADMRRDQVALNGHTFSSTMVSGSPDLVNNKTYMDKETGWTIAKCDDNYDPQKLFDLKFSNNIKDMVRCAHTDEYQNACWVEPAGFLNGEYKIKVCYAGDGFNQSDNKCELLGDGQQKTPFSAKLQIFTPYNSGYDGEVTTDETICPDMSTAINSLGYVFLKEATDSKYLDYIDYYSQVCQPLMDQYAGYTCPTTSLCPCDEECKKNNFMPPLTSTIWKQSTTQQKACWHCYQKARAIQFYCQKTYQCLNPDDSLNVVFDRNLKNFLQTGGKSHIDKLYGSGSYLCGYYRGVRCGCAKLKLLGGPRHLSRIARADNLADTYDYSGVSFVDNPQVNLFDDAVYVRQFYDVIQYAGNSICDSDKPAENGWKKRGTFFTPRLIVRAGVNERNIGIEYDKISSDPLKYLHTPIGTHSKYSGNNTFGLPVASTVLYGQFYPVIFTVGVKTNYVGIDDVCEVKTKNKLYYIALRMEYNILTGNSSLVAYKINTSRSSPTSTVKTNGAGNIKSFSLSQAQMQNLFFYKGDDILYNRDPDPIAPNTVLSRTATSYIFTNIGDVQRPPLKYTYDGDQPFIVSPITISQNFNTDSVIPGDVSTKVRLTLNPSSLQFVNPDEDEFKYDQKLPSVNDGTLIVDGLSDSQFSINASNAISHTSSVQNTDAILYLNEFSVGYPNACVTLRNIAASGSGLSVLQQEPVLQQSDCYSRYSGKDKFYCLLSHSLLRTCNAYMSCLRSSHTMDECKNESRDPKMYITEDDIEEYQINTDFRSKTQICITKGLELADRLSAISNVRKFGEYGNPKYDYSIRFKRKSKVFEGAKTRPLTFYGYDKVPNSLEDYQDNPRKIVPMTVDYFSSDKKHRDDVLYNFLLARKSIDSNTGQEKNISILEEYYPDCKFNFDTCKDNLTVEHRQIYELNGKICMDGVNTTDGEWNLKGRDMSTDYHIYVPLRCQYLYFEAFGGGGSGMITRQKDDEHDLCMTHNSVVDYAWATAILVSYMAWKRGMEIAPKYDATGGEGSFVKGIIDINKIQINDGYLAAKVGSTTYKYPDFKLDNCIAGDSSLSQYYCGCHQHQWWDTVHEHIKPYFSGGGNKYWWSNDSSLRSMVLGGSSDPTSYPDNYKGATLIRFNRYQTSLYTEGDSVTVPSIFDNPLTPEKIQEIENSFDSYLEKYKEYFYLNIYTILLASKAERLQALDKSLFIFKKKVDHDSSGNETTLTNTNAITDINILLSEIDPPYNGFNQQDTSDGNAIKQFKGIADSLSMNITSIDTIITEIDTKKASETDSDVIAAYDKEKLLYSRLKSTLSSLLSFAISHRIGRSSFHAIPKTRGDLNSRINTEHTAAETILNNILSTVTNLNHKTVFQTLYEELSDAKNHVSKGHNDNYYRFSYDTCSLFGTLVRGRSFASYDPDGQISSDSHAVNCDNSETNSLLTYNYSSSYGHDSSCFSHSLADVGSLDISKTVKSKISSSGKTTVIISTYYNKEQQKYYNKANSTASKIGTLIEQYAAYKRFLLLPIPTIPPSTDSRHPYTLFLAGGGKSSMDERIFNYDKLSNVPFIKLEGADVESSEFDWNPFDYERTGTLKDEWGMDVADYTYNTDSTSGVAVTTDEIMTVLQEKDGAGSNMSNDAIFVKKDCEDTSIPPVPVPMYYINWEGYRDTLKDLSNVPQFSNAAAMDQSIDGQTPQTADEVKTGGHHTFQSKIAGGGAFYTFKGYGAGGPGLLKINAKNTGVLTATNASGETYPVMSDDGIKQTSSDLSNRDNQCVIRCPPIYRKINNVDVYIPESGAYHRLDLICEYIGFPETDMEAQMYTTHTPHKCYVVSNVVDDVRGNLYGKIFSALGYCPIAKCENGNWEWDVAVGLDKDKAQYDRKVNLCKYNSTYGGERKSSWYYHMMFDKNMYTAMSFEGSTKEFLTAINLKTNQSYNLAHCADNKPEDYIYDEKFILEGEAMKLVCSFGFWQNLNIVDASIAGKRGNKDYMFPGHTASDYSNVKSREDYYYLQNDKVHNTEYLIHDEYQEIGNLRSTGNTKLDLDRETLGRTIFADQIYCPPIDSDLYDFDEGYSGNAVWRHTKEYNTANGTCITSGSRIYFSSSSGRPYRVCTRNGMWGPVYNPCGVGCKEEVDPWGTRWSVAGFVYGGESSITVTGACSGKYVNSRDLPTSMVSSSSTSNTRTCNLRTGMWSPAHEVHCNENITCIPDLVTNSKTSTPFAVTDNVAIPKIKLLNLIDKKEFDQQNVFKDGAQTYDDSLQLYFNRARVTSGGEEFYYANNKYIKGSLEEMDNTELYDENKIDLLSNASASKKYVILTFKNDLKPLAFQYMVQNDEYHNEFNNIRNWFLLLHNDQLANFTGHWAFRGNINKLLSEFITTTKTLDALQRRFNTTEFRIYIPNTNNSSGMINTAKKILKFSPVLAKEYITTHGISSSQVSISNDEKDIILRIPKTINIDLAGSNSQNMPFIIATPIKNRRVYKFEWVKDEFFDENNSFSRAEGRKQRDCNGKYFGYIKHNTMKHVFYSDHSYDNKNYVLSAFCYNGMIYGYSAFGTHFHLNNAGVDDQIQLLNNIVKGGDNIVKNLYDYLQPTDNGSFGGSLNAYIASMIMRYWQAYLVPDDEVQAKFSTAIQFYDTADRSNKDYVDDMRDEFATLGDGKYYRVIPRRSEWIFAPDGTAKKDLVDGDLHKLVLMNEDDPYCEKDACRRSITKSNRQNQIINGNAWQIGENCSKNTHF